MRGLALEGGGARGAFHVGVMKAMKEYGCYFDGVVGTSIGAYNAAMWVQGDFETLYGLWMTMQPADLFNVENDYMSELTNRHLSKEAIRYFTEQMRAIIKNKGIDVSKIKSFIEETVDENKIRDSKIDFGLVTVIVPYFKPVKLYKDLIPEGQVTDYIMASANYPGFKSEPIESQHYIDGGLHENCPISLLIERNYDEIVTVRTSQRPIKYKGKDSHFKMIDILPSDDLGGTLIFDNELIRRNIKMGYYDALRVIKGLEGRKYYIETTEESLFFDALCKVSKTEVNYLAKAYKLNGQDYKRVFFEGIIPRLAKQLKASKDASYQEIILLLLEEAAKTYGLERWRIYTLNQFIQAIEAKKEVHILFGDEVVRQFAAIMCQKLKGCFNQL